MLSRVTIAFLVAAAASVVAQGVGDGKSNSTQGIEHGLTVSNASATVYESAGFTGACGSIINDSDFVVAVSSAVFGSDTCGRAISIACMSIAYLSSYRTLTGYDRP
jgi:hypothetical protein